MSEGINARFIKIKTGGNYADLDAFMGKRQVHTIPFVVGQDVTPSNAQYAKISSSVLSGTLAVGTTSVADSGYSVAKLAGAIGTAATTAILDVLGNVLNLVDIRDVNGDPIKYGVGSSAKTIYGLLQCSSTVTDGDAIGAPASENLQISFVYYNGGTLTLTALDQVITFQANKLLLLKSTPTIEKVNGNIVPDILGSTVNATPTIRKFVVTVAFAANEVITLSTGSGASTGRSTASGDSITLNASDNAMIADNTCRIRYCGVQVDKGTGNDFVWDSTTTGHFTFPMDPTDKFEVERIIPIT